METKNNMGKKYIIELEDEPFGKNDDPRIPHGLEELWRVKGFKSLVFDKNGLNKLQPADEALESAYAHGETSAEAKYHEQAEKEKTEMLNYYNDGAHEMLDSIRYLYELNPDEMRAMGFELRDGAGFRQVINKYRAREIMQKVNRHIEKKREAALCKNINAIISDCGYSLEEIYKTAKEMLDES